ncbi:MAG TPA: c-type cytochrome [Longimicrobiaceae bacterium]
MTRVRRIFAAALLSPVLLSGCTDWAGYDLDYFWGNFPALATMRPGVGYDPYEMPRLPAENSVPVASELGPPPAPFTQAQLDSVAATLVNPYAGQATPEVLARGEALFAAQCAVCHGPGGAGDGTVIGPGKFPMATPLNTGTALTRSDGYIYAVMTVGRGLMPPYGEKLGHADRWAVVEYVRSLQRGGGAGGSAQAAAPGAGANGQTDTAAVEP